MVLNYGAFFTRHFTVPHPQICLRLQAGKQNGTCSLSGILKCLATETKAKSDKMLMLKEHNF